MTAFHLARVDLPEVRAMAELFPIDQIFDNPAYPGLLANAFIAAGIPALHHGPGDLRLAHGVGEQVPVEDLLLSARSLALLALRTCGVA